MALLSDRESFDKVALIRAIFRIESDPYIRKIRNEGKRKYAEAMADYFEGSTYPEYKEFGLSLMGAQAVRLTLTEFWNKAVRNR